MCIRDRAWGVAHWDATRIPHCATLPEERL
ncbi:hypothetical protein, partial [Pseudomonas aeruginosa]